MNLIKILIGFFAFITLAEIAKAEIAKDCEEKTLAYQNKHGGDLIYLNPLKPNGSYELCRYCGHWLNYVYTPELGKYYYDAQSNTKIGITEESVREWYKYNNNKEIDIWNISQGEHPPFSLIRM